MENPKGSSKYLPQTLQTHVPWQAVQQVLVLCSWVGWGWSVEEGAGETIAVTVLRPGTSQSFMWQPGSLPGGHRHLWECVTCPSWNGQLRQHNVRVALGTKCDAMSRA